MKIIIKTLLLVQIWFGTYFILLPGASLLPDVTYVHIVLATSLISLLHTVLDGGPRKWTYEDPSKPMTYQHAPRQRVHKYTMSFGDAILYLSRLKSFLNTLGVHLTHRVRFFWFKRDLWQYNRPSLTLGWEALHRFYDLVYYPHWQTPVACFTITPEGPHCTFTVDRSLAREFN
jgi:hypothetical protein